MRSLILFTTIATLLNELEAAARHACQQDSDCGKFGSPASYPFQCCTTVVCNVQYGYFLVSSGCIAVPNPSRRCGKVAEASETGRFAAQLRIADWRAVQGRVGENCELARQQIPSTLGQEPPPPPSFLDAPVGGAALFNRRFPTRTTPAPYANVKTLSNLGDVPNADKCLRPNRYREECEGRGGSCCITIVCEKSERRRPFSSFVPKEQPLFRIGNDCPTSCALLKNDQRTFSKRISTFYFPGELWERYFYRYLDESYGPSGEPASPLEDCDELGYFYFYVRNNEENS